MSDKYTASKQELEDFISAAGFPYGWENLESQARRMAEHAVAELKRQAAQMKCEREVGGAVAEIYEYRREHNVVNSPMLTGIRFTGMPLPVGTKLYTAPRAAVPDGMKGLDAQALDRCCTELTNLINLDSDYGFDEITVQTSQTSIDCIRMCEAMLAAAPEVTNTWTYEKPTERGWYWYTENGNVTHHFVSQRPGHTYLCIEVEPHGFNMKRDFRPVERMHGQWMKMQQPAAPEVTK